MQKPSEQLVGRFPFKATKSQAKLFHLLDTFLLDQNTPRKTFVLKGYAGTGKTSVVSALVKVLPKLDYKFVLLAPTGRAAKVMSVYALRKAFTIHKIIFSAKEDPKSGRMVFKRLKNKSKNTIYLVDEASMINNSSEFGRVGLLTSLIDYVFEEHFSGNKLILIGDTAQLPPVHQDISPALNIDHLRKDHDLQVTDHLLTEVVRQGSKSGILLNATTLRDQIAKAKVAVKLTTKSYTDVFSMQGNRMEDGLRYAYDKFGVENTCVITRSNKSATMYNKFIRQQIHFRENEIEAGDYLMIVKNNYDWLPLDSKAGFLANGEYVEVMRVNNFDEKYGLRFADLTLRLVDYPDHDHFEAKVMLDTLHSYTPALTQDEFRELQNQVLLEYIECDTKEEQMAMVRADEHLNALQVKYAYALTCHKSQGGQWNAVFVDQGYVNNDMVNVEWMRWLYTAMTRATDELFLVNFHSRFF
ncbi:MAG: ATP-dependent DNA helicase [Flammeovirgaceae bacterium]